MEDIPRHSRRTRLTLSAAVKRRIAAAVVVLGFVALAVETALREHSIAVYVAPFLAVVCCLEYLRATHRWPR